MNSKNTHNKNNQLSFICGVFDFMIHFTYCNENEITLYSFHSLLSTCLGS